MKTSPRLLLLTNVLKVWPNSSVVIQQLLLWWFGANTHTHTHTHTHWHTHTHTHTHTLTHTRTHKRHPPQPTHTPTHPAPPHPAPPPPHTHTQIIWATDTWADGLARRCYRGFVARFHSFSFWKTQQIVFLFLKCPNFSDRKSMYQQNFFFFERKGYPCSGIRKWSIMDHPKTWRR